MTILAKNPHDISNWFDDLTNGIGLRNSSFSDVDRLMVVHDGGSRRFLYCELKRAHEALSEAQRKLLADLARIPGFTVWQVAQTSGDLIAWRDFGNDETRLLSREEFRELYRAWWNPQAFTREESR